MTFHDWDYYLQQAAYVFNLLVCLFGDYIKVTQMIFTKFGKR